MSDRNDPRDLIGGCVPAQPVAPRIEVIVRWQTALPIKQAVARFHYGDYVEPSWDIAKRLALQEPYYIAGVIGLPQSLAGSNPEDLKSDAVLKIRSEPPIQAVAILVEKLMGQAVNVFLFFPKRQEGARHITITDKEVEVVLSSSTMEIRRKFKLKDLIYGGKLEL